MRDELDPGEWENDGGGGRDAGYPRPSRACRPQPVPPPNPFRYTSSPVSPIQIVRTCGTPSSTSDCGRGAPVDALGGAAHARSE